MQVEKNYFCEKLFQVKNKNKGNFTYELRNTGDSYKEYAQLWKNGKLHKDYNERKYAMEGIELKEKLFDVPCAALAEGEGFTIHLKHDTNNNFIAFAHPLRKGNKTTFEFFVTFTRDNRNAEYLLPKHLVLNKVFSRMKKFGFISNTKKFEQDSEPYENVYKTYSHGSRTLRHLITDSITILNRLKRQAEAELIKHIKNGKLYLLDNE